MLKGKRIGRGSKIGIVAPANTVEKGTVTRAKEKLEELGYIVELGESCYSSWYTFAGRDEVRARDINRMFADEGIEGIICLRGGYGSIRLLDMLDYDVIRSNPKVFMGYSDITSIHGAIHEKCGLVTFHGPMATSNILNDFDEITAGSYYRSVGEENEGYVIENPEEYGMINSGCAEGQIVGGNLAVFMSTLGTPYEVDTRGKILFLEEIGEATYRVDRMLLQLLQGGKLDAAAGVILGDFANCNKDSETDFSLEEVFEDILGRIKIPVMTNLRSGHCKPMLTLPLGARVYMDTERGIIEVKEGTVR